MNFLKLNIRAIARDARYEPESQRTLARVYWIALILFFLVMVSAGIAYGAYEFSRPLTPPESEIVVGNRKPPINRAELQTVLDGFDMRTVRFDERRAEPTLRDPS